MRPKNTENRNSYRSQIYATKVVGQLDQADWARDLVLIGGPDMNEATATILGELADVLA